MDIKKSLVIYVVEDNKIYNKLVCEHLKKQGFQKVTPFFTGKECIEKVTKGQIPHIVIQDYYLDDMNGIDVLQEVKKYNQRIEFIFLTANDNLEVAVNSIKYGAYDYITKDSDIALQKVVNKIEKVYKIFELQKRNKVIKQAMVISVIILVLIVLFAMLHVLFDAFGIKNV